MLGKNKKTGIIFTVIINIKIKHSIKHFKILTYININKKKRKKKRKCLFITEDKNVCEAYLNGKLL